MPEMQEVFDWDPSSATESVMGATSEDLPDKYYPTTYFFTCPNNKCGAPLKISFNFE
jgi:hypothetical protein